VKQEMMGGVASAGSYANHLHLAPSELFCVVFNSCAQ